jgi:hypothetical protein
MVCRGSADARQSRIGVQADSQITQRDDPHDTIVFDHWKTANRKFPHHPDCVGRGLLGRNSRQFLAAD